MSSNLLPDSLPATFLHDDTRRDGIIQRVRSALQRAEDDDDDIDFEYVLEALGDAQKELIASRKEITELRSKVADFALSKAAKAVASRHKHTGGHSASTAATSDLGSVGPALDPAEIRQAPAIVDGKKVDTLINPEAIFFALFHSPAVTTAAFSRSNPMFVYDSPERYPARTGRITRNAETGAMDSPISQPAYLDGLVSELYASIAPVFHSFMAKSVEFPKLFVAAVQGARSNHLGRLRTQAGLIFDLPQTVFVNPKSAKKSEPALPPKRLGNERIRTLIGYTPGAEHGDYMFLPPLYYQDCDVSKAHGLFHSEILVEIAKILLYGPSKAAPRSNNPYFRKGRVVTTTIGLVSTVCAYAVHLLSNDTVFAADGQGNHTSINYLAIIDNNKRVIVTVGARDANWYASFKRFWNSRLFPQLTVSLGSSHEEIDIGLDDEIERLMRQLDLENSEAATSSAALLLPDDLSPAIDTPRDNDDNDDNDDIYCSDEPREQAYNASNGTAHHSNTPAITNLTPLALLPAARDSSLPVCDIPDSPQDDPQIAPITKPVKGKGVARGSRSKTTKPGLTTEVGELPEDNIPVAARVTRSRRAAVPGKKS